jgi:ribosomal protein S18 acetylase RimI-like enzyme
MSLTVRRAEPHDLVAIARLGAQLIALHHQWDARRFFAIEHPEEGYRWFLGTQLATSKALVLVAVFDGRVAGYLYGTVEPRDWNMLLDEHGTVHDLFVGEPFRGRGVARALLSEGLARLEAMGAPRIVLNTALGNAPAQALFESFGFRRTMVEMTRG